MKRQPLTTAEVDKIIQHMDTNDNYKDLHPYQQREVFANIKKVCEFALELRS